MAEHESTDEQSPPPEPTADQPPPPEAINLLPPNEQSVRQEMDDVLTILQGVAKDSALVSCAHNAQSLAAATGIMLTNAVSNQQLAYMTAQAASVRNVILIQDDIHHRRRHPRNPTPVSPTDDGVDVKIYTDVD